jgi:hypothetical protein
VVTAVVVVAVAAAAAAVVVVTAVAVAATKQLPEFSSKQKGPSGPFLLAHTSIPGNAPFARPSRQHLVKNHIG